MVQTSKIAATLLLAALVLTACSDPLGDRYVGFAQCISEKGATMYGAYWCPHCANQKKLFGYEGFAKVKYVECDPRGRDAQPELCKTKKIEGYPTWEFADGSRMSGEVSLEKLADKTKCELPKLGQQEETKK